MVQWDFSKIFGLYVCAFAALAVLFGKFILRESVPSATWFGLVLIVVGGLIIQFGPQR
jgi:drug/metabolite transporter (DMT)-like permease